MLKLFEIRAITHTHEQKDLRKFRKAGPAVKIIKEWLDDGDYKYISLHYPSTTTSLISGGATHGRAIFNRLKTGWIRLHHTAHPTTPHDDEFTVPFIERMDRRDSYVNEIYEQFRGFIEEKQVHICTTFPFHDEIECRLALGDPIN